MQLCSKKREQHISKDVVVVVIMCMFVYVCARACTRVFS